MTITSNLFESPFSEYNADILDDIKIKKYWVTPLVQSKLDEYFDSHPDTVFLVGPRGSGKTMILKYYSYGVQVLLEESKRTDAIGFYVKCDKIAIKEMHMENETEEKLFLNYIVLFMINALLSVVQIGIENGQVSEDEVLSLICELNQCRNFENLQSMDMIQKKVISLIEKIQEAKKREYYGNYAYEEDSYFTDLDLFGVMIDNLKSKLSLFKSKNILVMLEQYEDYSFKQQCAIKKIIDKWHQKGVYFRISSRLARVDFDIEESDKTRDNVVEIDFMENVQFEEINNLLRSIANGYLSKSEYLYGKSNNIDDYLGRSVDFYNRELNRNIKLDIEMAVAEYLRASKISNQKKRIYSGFELLAQLCQCNIRLFINICNNIFMRVYYKDLSLHNVLLPFGASVQSDGIVEEVYKSFESFMYIENYGNKIVNLVVNLGMAIEHFQLSEHADVSGLGKIKFENISEEGKSILLCCKKWGIMYCKDDCYILDESLSAIFGYNPFISDKYALVADFNLIDFIKDHDKLNYKDLKIVRCDNDYINLDSIMEDI